LVFGKGETEAAFAAQKKRGRRLVLHWLIARLAREEKGGKRLQRGGVRGRRRKGEKNSCCIKKKVKEKIGKVRVMMARGTWGEPDGDRGKREKESFGLTHRGRLKVPDNRGRGKGKEKNGRV